MSIKSTVQVCCDYQSPPDHFYIGITSNNLKNKRMLLASIHTPVMNTANPPAYSPSDDFNHLMEKSESPMVLPREDEPGFATASALSRGLQVPSAPATVHRASSTQ